jgi:hypothetical protein
MRQVAFSIKTFWNGSKRKSRKHTNGKPKRKQIVESSAAKVPTPRMPVKIPRTSSKSPEYEEVVQLATEAVNAAIELEDRMESEALAGLLEVVCENIFCVFSSDC